jgi:hypothetical protein
LPTLPIFGWFVEFPPAAFAWKDPQSRAQAVLVARSQAIDWNTRKKWFAGEGQSVEEFERFREAVRAVA